MTKEEQLEYTLGAIIHEELGGYKTVHIGNAVTVLDSQFIYKTQIERLKKKLATYFMEEYKQQPAAPQSSLPEIPDWIIKYDQANHQSSAGKAIRFLMDRTKQLQAENTRLLEELQQAKKWLQHYETKL